MSAPGLVRDGSAWVFQFVALQDGHKPHELQIELGDVSEDEAAQKANELRGTVGETIFPDEREAGNTVEIQVGPIGNTVIYSVRLSDVNRRKAEFREMQGQAADLRKKHKWDEGTCIDQLEEYCNIGIKACEDGRDGIEELSLARAYFATCLQVAARDTRRGGGKNSQSKRTTALEAARKEIDEGKGWREAIDKQDAETQKLLLSKTCEAHLRHYAEAREDGLSKKDAIAATKNWRAYQRRRKKFSGN